MKCLSCKMEEMQEATNPYFVKLSNCYVMCALRRTSLMGESP